MVQIPVFNASQTSSKIPGVPTGVANPTAAAVLPYQAMANVGETILNQGIRSYGQDLDFKTKKYELDKNLQTQKYKLSKEKEIKEFEIREKYQLENYKQNEELKLTWQENRVKLQRETTIKNGLNDLTKIFHQMTTEAQNNPDTDSAMDAWDKGMNDAFENVKNGIKDEYTKKLFELEYNDKYVAERLTAVDSVDKNILQNNLIAFEDQVDTLKNEALYGSNGNIKTQAWLKLFGENSIFDQRHNKGNLKINGKPVLPHVYKEIIKKEVFETQGDLLSKNSPDRFLTLKENGYWNDKLSDTKIGDFTDQANRVLAAEQSAYLTDLRSQKTSFNSAVTDFTDPGNPDYFGNLAQYDTMLNNGINLVQTLNAAGLKNEAQSVLNSLKDLESAKLNHNVILDLKDQPLDVIRDNLKALKSLNQATSGTHDHDQRMIDLEPHIEKLITYMESNIENNAIGIAESTGMQVPVLDFLEPDINKFAESAQGYNQFVLANTDKYQLPAHQFFREENLFKFKEVFDTGNKEEILTLVRNISLVAGTNSNDAFRQLGQKSPLFAHMGMMMMLNNGASTEATEMMVNGWIGSRNPDNAALVKNIPNKDSTDFKNKITGMFSSAYFDTVPETYNQITEASQYIFTDMVLNNVGLQTLINEGEFDDDAIQEALTTSIQYAAGMVKKGSTFNGGIEMFNDTPIIIPQHKANGSLDSFDMTNPNGDTPSLEFLLENYLTDDMLFTATATVGDHPIHEKAHYNNMPYDFHTNKEITAADLFTVEGGYESIYLETADYGEYYITRGNPGSPGVETYMNKKQEKVTLNINRILPLLLAAHKENPQIIVETSTGIYSSTMGMASGM
tara:strand:+ start:2489 stop:5029 length:2541 start_codon:yes stop_codon:yes gene_type:complete